MAANKPDWDAIKNEYVTTRIGQRALAKKYGVAPKTLADHSRSEGWVEQRERFRRKVDAKSLEKAADKASEYKSKIERIANKIADQIEDVVDAGDLRDGDANIRTWTGALKDIADILAIKSDADVAEQQARIDKLRADAARAQESDEGKEITVRIEGAPEAWSE